MNCLKIHIFYIFLLFLASNFALAQEDVKIELSKKNILLDENGGPNHKGNFCFAPIHADVQTGELIYTPSYYYIGHFSKFVRPNAKRVSTASSRSSLLSTSFANTNGKMVTVVMNKSADKIIYNFIVGSVKTVIEIPPHAIQTLVY
jgi:glucosylceramidase